MRPAAISNMPGVSVSLGAFCRFAARENVKLRWRGRTNQAGTRYRVVLTVELAAHVRHDWSDVFPIERPLAEALDFVAAKYQPFYRELIERRRSEDQRVIERVA
jgi:hypothetical protein